MKNPKIETRLMFVLSAAIALGAVGVLINNIRNKKSAQREVSITIGGNVQKPGLYRFPYGITRFEALRVAGVQKDSDIGGLNLYAQAADGEKIQVGKLQKEVSLNPPKAAGGENLCEVVFATGAVSIAKKTGGSQPAKPQMALAEGDRIVSGPDGLVEIKTVDGSQVDLHPNSKLELTSLFKSDDQGGVLVRFNLAAGRLWSQVRTQPENVRFSFATPHLRALIRGTELEITAGEASSRVSVIMGTVLVEKLDGAEPTTLNTGNFAEVFADASKTVQMGSADPAARPMDEAYKKFTQDKEKFLTRSEVIRMLFFGLPSYYFLFEFDQQAGAINIHRVSEKLPLGNLISGVEEFGKAYLYGGIDLSRSILERMSGKRIKYHFAQGRDEVAVTIDELGGLNVNVDANTAEYLKVKPGMNTLDGKNALRFASPGRDSDASKSLEKQNTLLGGVIDKLKKGNVFTAALLIKVFGMGQTNIDVNYAVSVHKSIDNMAGWKVNYQNFAPAAGN